jgi:hypothetical protein
MFARKPQPSTAASRRSSHNAERKKAALKSPAAPQAVAQLRRRLAEVEAELESFKSRHRWVESALVSQRHGRQVLEAAISATYNETINRIRDVVRAAIPRDATVLVVSKGDEELLKLDGRRGWHFPQDTDGGYAGHYPSDSAAAIEHLQVLIAKGAQYLLLPNTAFWWLEHYRGFEDHLERVHLRIWRDDRCALYILRRDLEARLTSSAEAKRCDEAPSNVQALPPASAPLPDIVCFPIISWDYRFQRPQQLMRQFAIAGHRVFYLSYEFRTKGEPYILRPLAERISEVSLRGSHFKVRQGLLDEDSRQALIASLAALRTASLPGAAVALVQSAFWWPVIREAAAAFGWPIVYDCMDHHAGFTASNPLTVEQERELLAGADLVVASSAGLEREARKLNRQVLLLRNACDYDHFAKVRPKLHGARPVIGYYGAIAEWFDSDLVADLAKRRPDWDFILVGSSLGADIRRLSRLPNMTLPGEKPYAEIPDWLAKFDVTILPFRRTPLTEATNPVKAYEIFAAGKPLVSVPLPEITSLVPLARLASTVKDFEREIENELCRPDPGLELRRRAVARDNTWRKRFDVLAPAIERVCQHPRRADRLVAAPKHLDSACSAKRKNESKSLSTLRTYSYEPGPH